MSEQSSIVKVRIQAAGHQSLVPVHIPDLDQVRAFAARLHAANESWTGELFGWEAEYNPERAEPPIDSRMTFTPADFVIGESGIWLFSLMWEDGRESPPVEYLDDSSLVRE